MPEPRSAWPVRLAEAAYRGLRWLYPAEFRQRFGPELAQVFRDEARAAYRQGGLLGVVRLCGPTLSDLLTTATAEQLAASRHTSANTPREWFLTGLAMLLVFLVLMGPGQLPFHPAVEVDLAGRSIAGIHLEWIFVLVAVLGIVLCFAKMAEFTRQQRRPRSWFLSWAGVFGASLLSAFAVHAIWRTDWTEAFMLSYAVCCFAVAVWLVVRSRQVGV